jgi:hypothetical protein
MKEDIKLFGWEERSTAEEPRLSEMVELYKELGFEVCLEDYKPSECSSGECNTCMSDNPDKYKIIYTRKNNLTQALT